MALTQAKKIYYHIYLICIFNIKKKQIAKIAMLLFIALCMTPLEASSGNNKLSREERKQKTEAKLTDMISKLKAQEEQQRRNKEKKTEKMIADGYNLFEKSLQPKTAGRFMGPGDLKKNRQKK